MNRTNCRGRPAGIFYGRLRWYAKALCEHEQSLVTLSLTEGAGELGLKRSAYFRLRLYIREHAAEIHQALTSGNWAPVEQLIFGAHFRHYKYLPSYKRALAFAQNGPAAVPLRFREKTVVSREIHPPVGDNANGKSYPARKKEMHTESLIKLAAEIAAELALNTALIVLLLAPLLVLAWNLSVARVVPGGHSLGYFEALGFLGLIMIARIGIRGIHVAPP